jgi:hypothetical protein
MPFAMESTLRGNLSLIGLPLGDVIGQLRHDRLCVSRHSVEVMASTGPGSPTLRSEGKAETNLGSAGLAARATGEDLRPAACEHASASPRNRA